MTTTRSLLATLVGAAALTTVTACALASPASAALMPPGGPSSSCWSTNSCPQTTTYSWSHNKQADVRATSFFPSGTQRTVQYKLSCADGYAASASATTVQVNGHATAEAYFPPASASINVVSCKLSQTVTGSWSTTVACGEGAASGGAPHAFLYFSNNFSALPSYGC